MTWLIFALMTVFFWGTYGVLLHAGQVGMNDPDSGRYKAFLWVGIAYFITAVLAPLLVLMFTANSWAMPSKGIWLSLGAGVVGAGGAFCVLLAFGFKGHPAQVMSIVFAGAPIVNAFVALALHPPAGGWGKLPMPFMAGIALAAIGGCLVTLYKPAPAKAAPPPESPPAHVAPAEPDADTPPQP